MSFRCLLGEKVSEFTMINTCTEIQWCDRYQPSIPGDMSLYSLLRHSDVAVGNFVLYVWDCGVIGWHLDVIGENHEDDHRESPPAGKWEQRDVLWPQTNWIASTYTRATLKSKWEGYTIGYFAVLVLAVRKVISASEWIPSAINHCISVLAITIHMILGSGW
jgi:hypothetical protein